MVFIDYACAGVPGDLCLRLTLGGVSGARLDEGVEMDFEAAGGKGLRETVERVFGAGEEGGCGGGREAGTGGSAGGGGRGGDVDCYSFGEGVGGFGEDNGGVDFEG